MRRVVRSEYRRLHIFRKKISFLISKELTLQNSHSSFLYFIKFYPHHFVKFNKDKDKSYESSIKMFFKKILILNLNTF